MATSFGALCTDFYINLKLALKMDLPSDRETVLHMFDRVRAEMPQLERFKRFSDELALESPRSEGEYQWLALRRQSIRCGHVNPETMDAGFALQELALKLAPFYLAISPLDIDYLELMFGFDMECKANHHELINEALMEHTAMSRLLEVEGARPMDVQPVVGFVLPDRTQVFFEVKPRTSVGQVRAGRFRTEPISVVLTVRRGGPVDKVERLNVWLEELRDQAERLAHDKLVPELVAPISRAILGSV